MNEYSNYIFMLVVTIFLHFHVVNPTIYPRMTNH